jgi:hypothetical protein
MHTGLKRVGHGITERVGHEMNNSGSASLWLRMPVYEKEEEAKEEVEITGRVTRRLLPTMSTRLMAKL